MTNAPEANTDAAWPQPADVIAPGTILLAATPIGNVLDASARLVFALAQADIVAAEDTRRALNLAGRLGIRIAGKLVAYHEHNEAAQTPWLIEQAQAGQRILMISDAGMPCVSDPGYRLIEAAHQSGVPASIAPGPSAVLTALALSGMPTDRWIFEGFMPRKRGEQERFFSTLATQSATTIVFDSPRRLQATLSHMAEILPERQVAVCRELTKTYEDVWVGTPSQLAERAENARGEIVIVIRGAGEMMVDDDQAIVEVLALVDQGMKLKAAARHVAHQYGLRSRALYQGALDARQG
ncbi:16S rRNA (cytidine(1402)-2'-O)-methyltransferase [Actinomyces vulturis]|uniref:16S rRNA (cytidine(1402)-2'-O)-methyltransferase n=1 Tax=Actinomyces vulturis TaxID=1857645 RepID=UPI00082DAB2C|nr:16S rRNA (cytidine(1402)-2'-O)-methyltransferase [Actinomyces vulturis]